MGYVKADCHYCDHEVVQDDVEVDHKEAAFLIVLDSMKEHVKVEHEEEWSDNSEHYDVDSDF